MEHFSAPADSPFSSLPPPYKGNAWAALERSEKKKESTPERKEPVPTYDPNTLPLFKKLTLDICLGTYDCSICSEAVLPGARVWSCQGGCYAVLHLYCVQKWFYHRQMEKEQEHGSTTTSNTSSSSSFPFSLATRSGGVEHRREGLSSTTLLPSPYISSFAQSSSFSTSGMEGIEGRIKYTDLRCPICRHSAEANRVQSFFCYCGKVLQPPAAPLLPAGSCGETCGRSRGPFCSHRCTERCHPGPCPPCERRRVIYCYCDRGEKERAADGENTALATIRSNESDNQSSDASQKPLPSMGWGATNVGSMAPSPHRRVVACDSTLQHFSCELPCGRLLSCGTHYCTQACHEDHSPGTTTSGGGGSVADGGKHHRCPPCMHWEEVSCYCGKEKKWMSCEEIRSAAAVAAASSISPQKPRQETCNSGSGGVSSVDSPGAYSCHSMCGRRKACGRHRCAAPCHPGACAPCQRSPSMQLYCPCGKVRLSTLYHDVTTTTATTTKTRAAVGNTERLTTSSADEKGTVSERQYCSDPIPTCGLPCEKPLPCGHVCWRLCHDDAYEVEADLIEEDTDLTHVEEQEEHHETNTTTTDSTSLTHALENTSLATCAATAVPTEAKESMKPKEHTSTSSPAPLNTSTTTRTNSHQDPHHLPDGHAPPSPSPVRSPFRLAGWYACGPCKEVVSLPCRCGQKNVKVPCFCLYLPSTQWNVAATASGVKLPFTLLRDVPALQEGPTSGDTTTTTAPSSSPQNLSSSSPSSPPTKDVTAGGTTAVNDLLPPRCTNLCRKLLSCGKHRCPETCCTLNDHICPKICQRKRNCGQHTCELLCHKGLCPPCPVVYYERQYCPCGSTFLDPPFPCGTTMPPCPQPCRIVRSCGHQGGHTCHDPVKTECPPCVVLVPKFCASHCKQMPYFYPCHRQDVVCGKRCGKFLSCCHTYCEKKCHAGECTHKCGNQPPSYREALTYTRKKY